LHRVQVDHVDLTALDSHQCLSSPSASASLNSALMRLSSRFPNPDTVNLGAPAEPAEEQTDKKF